MITIESKRLSGSINLEPAVHMTDNGYRWSVLRTGLGCRANPVGGGATVVASGPDDRRGSAGSAHEAELAAAAALTEMARETRALIAAAEARLANREAANAAAAAATERLSAIVNA